MKHAWSILLTIASAACGGSERATPPAKDGAAVAMLLAHLPADTDAIVAGSLPELARWPLWRRAVSVVAHEAPGVADQIVRQCNLDPWTAFGTAALAFTVDLDSALLAAETTVDRARLHACATAVGSGVALAIEDGPLTRYRSSEAIEVAAWMNDRVFLALPQRMDDPEALKQILPERAVPAPLQHLLGRVDRSATVWGIALASGDSLIAELMGMLPLASKPVGLHAALHRRIDGLRARAALVFADASGAREAAAVFQKLLAEPPSWLTPWREALRVQASGDEARITLELDAARAGKLDDTVISLLPAPTEPPAPKASAPPSPR